MSHPQYPILEATLRWLEQGEKVWLCTILQTWGSSPRPAGSMLAVSASGAWSGSVSGGCLEEDLLQRAASTEQPERPIVTDYGITDEDQGRFRLPCGGRMKLLIEPLTADRHRDALADLVIALADNLTVRREVNLETGSMTIEPGIFAPAGIEQSANVQVSHVLGPECRLLLVGAGEVAAHVAAFGRRCGFEVALCEPREAFLKGWSDTETPAITALPDDLVTASYNDRFCAVLALAHDPRVDDMALLAALQSACFYVGAMGSVATSHARRERLLSLGLTEAQLDRLHAPVGIAIRSKTPAEIAISIVADLVDTRHRLLAGRAAL